jgi:Flp pilus assembly protein TadG
MTSPSESGAERPGLQRPGVLRFLRRFAHARRGGIVPLAAAGVPVVALLAIAATELASLSHEKGRMQDVADAVALDAANQLSFSPAASVMARAEANARAQLASLEPRTTLTIKAEMVDASAVRIAVNGVRLSFFGNMLPPGGFKTAAQATATTMNTAPLCVVVLDPGARVGVDAFAQVDAAECLVHSNGDVETSNGGRLTAAAIQAGDSAFGSGLTPAASTGAKLIEDPFASSALHLPAGCLDTNKKLAHAGSATLGAGRHCGHLDIEGTTVTLAPGVHVFNGEIQLKIGTRLIGRDVLIVFEPGARFTIDDPGVRLDIAGLKTSEPSMNGFVFAAAPGRTEPIELMAGHIERLEGVVYAPQAEVRVLNGKTLIGELLGLLVMGEKSKWTVVVAKRLEVGDGAEMAVNADYFASDVPVPAGVGNKSSRETRLLH